MSETLGSQGLDAMQYGRYLPTNVHGVTKQNIAY